MYVNQTGNFTHDFKMCSYEQLTRLHNASLEVLERTGVKIFEDTALKILAEGGAYVDFDSKGSHGQSCHPVCSVKDSSSQSGRKEDHVP